MAQEKIICSIPNIVPNSGDPLKDFLKYHVFFNAIQRCRQVIIDTILRRIYGPKIIAPLVEINSGMNFKQYIFTVKSNSLDFLN